jgi:hypothetical protein
MVVVVIIMDVEAIIPDLDQDQGQGLYLEIDH